MEMIEKHTVGTTRTYQCTSVNPKVGPFVNVFRIDSSKGYIKIGRNKTPVCWNEDDTYVSRRNLTHGDFCSRIVLLPLALSD